MFIDKVNQLSTLQMEEEVNLQPPPHWFPLATEQLRLRALTDVFLIRPTQRFVQRSWYVSG